MLNVVNVIGKSSCDKKCFNNEWINVLVYVMNIPTCVCVCEYSFVKFKIKGTFYEKRERNLVAVNVC